MKGDLRVTLEEIYTICAGTEIPVTYHAWPEGEAPVLPWIAIVEQGSDNFGADGIAYGLVKVIDIELYTRSKDPATEATIEAALTDAGLFWNKAETYIEAEKCFEIIYSLEV